MALTIAQDVSLAGADWWKWAVWTEGSDDELASVESVTYHLHPTFRQPVQQRRNRADRFRLEEEGWGELAIRARVRRAQGPDEELRHWLRLGPAATGRARDAAWPSEPKSKPTVFLSSSAADASVVTALRKSLAEDFEVRDAADVPPGDSWWSAIPEAIAASDAVVAVLSDASSAWVEREVDAAAARKLPVIPVTIGSGVRIPPAVADVHVVEVSGDVRGDPATARATGERVASCLRRQPGVAPRK